MSLESKIDKLIERISESDTKSAAIIAKHSAQLTQITEDKKTYFTLHNSTYLPAMRVIELNINTLEVNQKSNLEKIEENKVSINNGLATVRQDLLDTEKKSEDHEKEQEEKIDNLIEVYNQSVGSRKTWNIVNSVAMIAIALLGVYATLNDRSDTPKTEKVATP